MIDAEATGGLGEIVEDRLLDGRLRLRQPRKGHRAGSDAVLLAAALPERDGGHLLDIGTGVGTVGTALLGIALFGEPATAMRLACITLIVVGIAGLKFLAG